MSAHENRSENEQARDARQRAEEMLSEVQSQRPEIEELSERALILLHKNSYSALVTQAFGRRTA